MPNNMCYIGVLPVDGENYAAEIEKCHLQRKQVFMVIA